MTRAGDAVADRILAYVRRFGPVEIAGVVRGLRLNKETVRTHLTAFEAMGVVKRQPGERPTQWMGA
jgi:predicted ArsR family transcriptional regulator